MIQLLRGVICQQAIKGSSFSPWLHSLTLTTNIENITAVVRSLHEVYHYQYINIVDILYHSWGLWLNNQRWCHNPPNASSADLHPSALPSPLMLMRWICICWRQNDYIALQVGLQLYVAVYMLLWVGNGIPRCIKDPLLIKLILAPNS